MTTCAVGLGSNIGDRLSHLRAATRGLAAVSRVVEVSPVYETAPVGGPEQDPYLNAVALVETARTPTGFLNELLLIERSRGRARGVRWGPRTLDLDILVWGDQAIDEPGLTVPHPRMLERRFVLEPLLAIWPDARMPNGSSVATALERVADQDLTPTSFVLD
ncbi:MAG: 2-amino-4-hydroxy-6-hydroxymethyldihydropteridine diphosphokinase [Actinomycetota bacterium]